MNADSVSVQQTLLQLPELERKTERLACQIPAQPDMGNLLESLSTQLAEVKATSQEVISHPMVEGRNYTRVPVVIRFRGSLDMTYRIIEHLEKSQRLVRIEKLQIDQVGDRGLPQVQISFSAFARGTEGSVSWIDAQ